MPRLTESYTARNITRQMWLPKILKIQRPPCDSRETIWR